MLTMSYIPPSRSTPRPKCSQLTSGRSFAIVSKRLDKYNTRGASVGAASSGGENLSETSFLVHSKNLPGQAAGELLSLPRQQAGWEWMSLFVRRLQPGEVYRARTDREEAAFVLLGGICQVDWGPGPTRIGKRKNVFDGLPYALYLPTGNQAVFSAETMCEIAECRAPSDARLQPKLITPSDEVSGLRGGGHDSRQMTARRRKRLAPDCKHHHARFSSG